MSFCSKCGKEIPENTKFCPDCGTPVEGATKFSYGGDLAQNPALTQQIPVKKKKSKTGIVAAIIILLVMVWLGSGFLKKEDKESRQDSREDVNTQAVTETSAMQNEKETEEQKDAKTITVPENGSTSVNLELKAFLDSYEAFVDEYVSFMQAYSSDPSNVVSMMADYTMMMGKYADFAQKIDAYDAEEMSPADAAYYLEVTTRCSQKMLAAANP